MKTEQIHNRERGASKLTKSTYETSVDTISELEKLDELWNAESEEFKSSERIGKRQKAVLPVSAHGRRGRPSRETHKSSRVRHRISQQGGMHKRRRKQMK